MPIRTASNDEWFIVQLTGPVGPEENIASFRAILRRNGLRLVTEQSDDGERIIVRVRGPHPARELRQLMETADLVGYFYAEEEGILV